MLLSIGMIVKNEEKYLDKCLNALKPLLENLNSELIIVDTGSTDSSVEIAKRYTDKVYYFEWCDDFSAARNETLRYALGDWYMYIDADEILHDASEIINFFKSNEYKKYNCASFIIRNYTNSSLERYADFNAFRLIKMNKNICFTGKIHETLSFYEPRRKFTNLTFHHYGYMFDIPELQEHKSVRNISLLLDSLVTDSNNPKLHNALGESYVIANQFEKALESFRTAYSIATSSKNVSLSLILAFHANLIKALIYCEDIEVADIEIDNYFNSKKNIHATDIDIYYSKLELLFKKNDYEKYIEYYSIYEKLLKKYEQGNLNTDDINIRPLYHANESAKYKSMLLAAISYEQCNNFEKAKEILCHPLMYSTEFLNYDAILKINLELSVMKYFKNYENFSKLFLLYSETNVDMDNIIEPFIMNYPSERMELIKSFNNFDFDSIKKAYSELMKIRLSDLNSDFNTPEMIGNFINKLDGINYELLYFILKYNLPLDLASNKLSKKSFIKFLEQIANVYGNISTIISEYKFIPTNDSDIYYMSKLYETGLLSIDDNQKNICLDLYHKFLKYSKIYLSTIYNIKNMNDKNIELFPEDVYFTYYCLNAEKCLENLKHNEYIKNLKLALNSNERMIRVISIIIENFENHEKKKIDTEFDFLAKAIKDNFQFLIQNNQYDEARMLLNEYRILNPNDSDIVILEKKLMS